MKKHDIKRIIQNELLVNEYIDSIQKSYLLIGQSSPLKDGVTYKDIRQEGEQQEIFSGFFAHSPTGSKFDRLIRAAQEQEFKNSFGVEFGVFVHHLGDSRQYKQGAIKPIVELGKAITPQQHQDTVIALEEIVQNSSVVGTLNKLKGFVDKQAVMRKIKAIREASNMSLPKNQASITSPQMN